MPSTPIDRRQFLVAAGTAGAIVVLDPVGFAFADQADEETRVVEGTLDRGVADWVYLPVRVPAGIREIAVTYSYDKPTVPPGEQGNALDIGVFDESGHELADAKGFRGWSGGFRDSFTISATEATPGYLPGPVRQGTWHVVLGPYTVAPQGLTYKVEITLRRGTPGEPFVPSHAPREAKGRGKDWYRGDLHLHTQHSDGRWEPAQLVAAAKEAGLDFVNSSEHNTSSAAGIWGHHASDDLLIIDGEEITTRNGHYVAAGLEPGTWIDWRYRSVDDALPRFLRQIHRQGALAIAAHPHCPFVGCSWKFGFEDFDAIEVWNGPWTADDEVSLYEWDGTLVTSARRGGRWTPAVGDSDSHNDTQVVGLPQNVVLASGLRRDAILSGIRAGHVYVAESASVGLTFGATAEGRTAGIGERLRARGDAKVTVELTVRGVTAGVVRILTDEGQLAQFTLADAAEQTVTWTTTPQQSAYVRAEVRRPVPTPTTPDTMVAFTNPIFLG
ncbi:MAG: phosphoesterase [Streptosporangiales bacterium]|nr:phosphoesterase [Streptosporangiales bacterium]